MDPDVAAFAQVAVIIVLMTGSLVTIAVAGFRAVIRTNRVSAPPKDDARLDHLQESVDAIAIEVERIAEAQRFTTKLLSERVEGAER
ncbi:MAG TPA: hypothetical protein VJ802_06950 [Gemmatimonadaceae bacterium]|nr:hypothetical protein [Gemmatimonadaceae bacterium]